MKTARIRWRSKMMAPSLSSEIYDLQELLMGELVPPSQGSLSYPCELRRGMGQCCLRQAIGCTCDLLEALVELFRRGSQGSAVPQTPRLRGPTPSAISSRAFGLVGKCCAPIGRSCGPAFGKKRNANPSVTFH